MRPSDTKPHHWLLFGSKIMPFVPPGMSAVSFTPGRCEPTIEAVAVGACRSHTNGTLGDRTNVPVQSE